MAKQFNTQDTINKFFTQTTEETQEKDKTQTTEETQEKKKRGRPNEFEGRYRFSLYLDGDLKEYIDFASWKKRKNITKYLNDLIRADMQEYLAKGGSEEEWKKKD